MKKYRATEAVSDTKKKPAKNYDGRFAAFRLRVVAVENERDGEWVNAWDELRYAYRQSMHLALVGAQCVAEGLAALYSRGKEHRGKGPHGITHDEARALSAPMYETMCRAAKASERPITSGHIAMLAQDMFSKEFSDGKDKAKLRDIIHGERGFPVPGRLGFPMRPADWWCCMEERELPKHEGQEAVIVTCPVVYVTSLVAKGGRVRLVCAPLRGRGAASTQALFDRVAEVPRGQQTVNADTGYKRGTATIKRIKRPYDGHARWMIVIAYGAPKVQAAPPKDCAIVIHRGVAHGLMMATVTPDDLRFHAWAGHEVVDRKAAFRAQVRRVSQDTHAPWGNGRGRLGRSKRLRALGDKEQRFTATAMWRAARLVERTVILAGATLAIVEDLGTFRCDIKDDHDRAIPPYIRDWPYAQLKGKIRDVLIRRQGFTVANVREVPAQHISQRCPSCQHTSEDNIARLPTVNASEEWRGGTFRCVLCRFTRDLDEVAIMNMIAASEIEWMRAAVEKQIAKWRVWRKQKDVAMEEWLPA